MVISEDEEYKRVDVERFSKLPTAFLVSVPFLFSYKKGLTYLYFEFDFRRKTVLLLPAILQF